MKSLRVEAEALVLEHYHRHAIQMYVNPKTLIFHAKKLVDAR